MPDASLVTLFDEVRGKTLALLNLGNEDVLWTPPGTDNHVLWHAGHILCVVERMVQGAVHNGQSIPDNTLPAEWWKLFGWDSDPTQSPRDAWPALDEIVDRLREQHSRLRSILAGLTEGRLSAPLRTPGLGWDGAPARRLLVHAFHDEACHSGEIWLLRKLARQRQTT